MDCSSPLNGLFGLSALAVLAVYGATAAQADSPEHTANRQGVAICSAIRRGVSDRQYGRPRSTGVFPNERATGNDYSLFAWKAWDLGKVGIREDRRISQTGDFYDVAQRLGFDCKKIGADESLFSNESYMWYATEPTFTTPPSEDGWIFAGRSNSSISWISTSSIMHTNDSAYVLQIDNTSSTDRYRSGLYNMAYDCTGRTVTTNYVKRWSGYSTTGIVVFKAEPHWIQKIAPGSVGEHILGMVCGPSAK